MLFDYLYPGQMAHRDVDSTELFAFKDAVKLRLRLRKTDQLRGWLYYDIRDPKTTETLIAGPNPVGLKFSHKWHILKRSAEPSQIVNVTQWSFDYQDWTRVDTKRRLVRDAPARPSVGATIPHLRLV